MDNIAFLITSCDAYGFLWEGWHHCFKKFVGFDRFRVYFLTENVVPYFVGQEHNCYSLLGRDLQWTDRILAALDQMPVDNVILSQDDHWFKQEAVSLFHDWRTFDINKWDALVFSGHDPQKAFGRPLGNAIGPSDQRYYFIPQNHPLFFSHLTTMWKKNHLKRALEPGELPWENEARGLKRMQRIRPAPIHYFRRVGWYDRVHQNWLRPRYPRRGIQLLKAFQTMDPAKQMGRFTPYGRQVWEEIENGKK